MTPLVFFFFCCCCCFYFEEHPTKATWSPHHSSSATEVPPTSSPIFFFNFHLFLQPTSNVPHRANLAIHDLTSPKSISNLPLLGAVFYLSLEHPGQQFSNHISPSFFLCPVSLLPFFPSEPAEIVNLIMPEKYLELPSTPLPVYLHTNSNPGFQVSLLHQSR